MKSRKSLFLIALLAVLVFQARPSLAQAKSTVTIWYDTTGDAANVAQCVVDNVVKVFNDQSKTIEIKAELLPNAWDATRTALAGGGAPDLVGTPGPSFAYDFAKAGYFAPIDDIAAQYGWAKSFSPWALDLGKVDGKLYTIPAEVETMVLYYNKTLFEANKWPIPKTMDDLVALVKTIKAAGIIPFAHANAEWRPANEWFVTSMFSNVAGPQKVYDALTGKAKWDDPAFVKALDILNAWQKDGNFMGGLDKYYTATFNESHTAFGDGKAAMNMEGSWFMANINAFFGDTAKNKNDWAWIPVPSADGKAIFPLGIGSTMSINAKAKDVKAAGEVLNYIFSPETQARQFVKCGIAPAGVKLAPEALKEVDPRVADLRVQLNTAADKGDYGYTTWTFWPPKSDTYIYETIEKVWAGSMTTAEYLQGLQKTFDAEFKAGSLPPIPKR
jgi:raffinose/stachyose/melibiose transport system substrate-binding protein